MNIDPPNEKHTKSKNDNTNDFFNILCDNVSKKIPVLKKLEKIDEDLSDHIPNFNESEFLIRYNYNVNQLKVIAKTYKLKVMGNKSQLISRIYSFLFLSNAIVKIQKIIRGNLQRKFIQNI